MLVLGTNAPDLSVSAFHGLLALAGYPLLDTILGFALLLLITRLQRLQQLTYVNLSESVRNLPCVATRTSMIGEY